MIEHTHWSSAPLNDMEVLAANSLQSLRVLTPATACNVIRGACDEPWMGQCVTPATLRCMGLYHLLGPDEKTRWPALGFEVTRMAPDPKVGYCLVYVLDGGWCCMGVDVLPAGQRIADFELRPE